MAKWIPLAITGLAVAGICSVVIISALGIGVNQANHRSVTIEVDPTGKHIVFTSDEDGLYTIDLNSKKVERIVSASKGASQASYSTDGKAIVFSTPCGEEGRGISMMTLSDLKITSLTNDPKVSDGQPRISPDGKSVAFVRANRHRPYSMGGMVWVDHDLYICSLADKSIRQLTYEKYRGAGPITFVDGGRSLIYSVMGGSTGGNYGACKISLAENARAATIFSPDQVGYRGGAWVSGLRFSLDGSKMTFISDRVRAYEYDVFVADANGSNARGLGLTKVFSYNQSPIFAPTGQSIYVLAGNAGTIFGLYNIDLSGRATKIADSDLFTHPETWKPKTD